MRLNTKNRVREEWTDIWLSIKRGEIEHSGPRSEDTVDLGFVLIAFKPAVNSVLTPVTPRSVVSNVATFDRQSDICSLFPHPVFRVQPASQLSEYPAWKISVSKSVFKLPFVHKELAEKINHAHTIQLKIFCYFSACSCGLSSKFMAWSSLW